MRKTGKKPTIRQGTGGPLTRLKPQSLLLVKSAQAAAEEKLGHAIRHLLSPENRTRHRRRSKSNLTSRDLLAAFEAYAVTVLDAEAEQRLPEINVSAGPVARRAVLRNLGDSVVARIAKPGAGVWPRLVKSACKFVGLWQKRADDEWWSPRYGTFTVAELMMPREDRLRSTLRLRMKYWESKAFEAAANREASRGPNHKTVKKILDGHHVRPGVLDSLADALSSKSPKTAPVTVANIPQA